MKKLSKILVCLTLAFISCFAMVGCKDNPPETPGEQPASLSFNECFGFSELTTYQGGLNCTSISELSQYGYYETISLYTKKDFNFNHISFKVSTEEVSDEEIYITIKFGDSANWHSVSTYTITSEKTQIDCYYVQGSVSGAKYFNNTNTGSNISISEYSIPKDTTVSICFGTSEGYQNYPASGEYLHSIKITDFFIE